MLARTIDNLLAELKSSPESEIPATAGRLMDRIRSMPKGEQADLLRHALAEWDLQTNPSSEGWHAQKTLLGVILHAVGVKTVDSQDEIAIREEIRQDLARFHTDPHAYRNMQWRPAAPLWNQSAEK